MLRPVVRDYSRKPYWWKSVHGKGEKKYMQLLPSRKEKKKKKNY